MLYEYMQMTQRLLWDFKQELIRPADLIYYINKARSQIAGEGECIRGYGTLLTASVTQVYPFSSITQSGSGIAGILNVRMMNIKNGSNVLPLNSYNWEWFNQYMLCQSPIPAAAQPTDWAQYGKGVNGTLFFNPIPDAGYTISVDAVCYPIPLVTDATAEAIPYPWTDAVPYYAAYESYVSAQRGDEASKMLYLYEQYVQRARRFSTPSVLPYQNPQNSNAGRPSPLGESPPSMSGGAQRAPGDLMPGGGGGGR